MYKILLSLICCVTLQAQNISAEQVEFEMLKNPKNQTEVSTRFYNVTVNSPYNVTAEDVINKAKKDHQTALAEYEGVVKKSEAEFQKKLKDHDLEVAKAKERYELESAEHKKLTLLERMTITDQGKGPKLVIPATPTYYKPAPPVYQEPNLNNHVIIDNNVLASQIIIDGFSKEGAYLDVQLTISAVQFQDNAGQSFVNQPTTLIVKVNGQEKINQKFFTEYKFLTSTPTNNISKSLEEKNHLKKVMTFVNQYLNDEFGYQSVKRTVKLDKVKNKGNYDDLEKAHIYITTNLKKIQPSDPVRTEAAFSGMQKGIDIWLSTLQNVDFKKDSKSAFNANIGEFIYFNLIRLNLALGKKDIAEKYLNELQENLISIKLSYDEQQELKSLENEIYKK